MNYEDAKETIFWFLVDVLIILCVVLGNSCCSLYFAPEPRGVSVRCERTCTEDEVALVPHIVREFAARFEFDPTQTLEVTFVEENGEWLGRTYDRNTVAITAEALLPHELLHVHYWRSTGDPDRNHELPGGPWTEEDNETARSIRVALGI